MDDSQHVIIWQLRCLHLHLHWNMVSVIENRSYKIWISSVLLGKSPKFEENSFWCCDMMTTNLLFRVSQSTVEVRRSTIILYTKKYRNEFVP